MSSPGREELLEACEASYRERYGRPPAVVAWAPGRINVIGEHTDYNLGLTLPGAVDRWAACALAPAEGPAWTVTSVDFGEEAVLDPACGAETVSTEPGWSRLVRGVLEIVHAPGTRVVIRSTVPIGSGLSSSAALCMSLLAGLRTLHHIPLTDRELIHLARETEFRRAGAPTGLMDQYAAWYGEQGKVLRLDLRSLQHRSVPGELPGHLWVVADSGVRRQLAETAYGRRVEETRRGLEAVRRGDPSVSSFRDLEPEHLDLLPDGVLRDRLQHYIEENLRVEEAVAALEAADAVEMGRLLDASHASLRDRYEVSCEELEALTATARSHPACAGARMMGGGFGGSTLNLVEREGVEGFRGALDVPSFTVRLVDGAGVLEI